MNHNNWAKLDGRGESNFKGVLTIGTVENAVE